MAELARRGRSRGGRRIAVISALAGVLALGACSSTSPTPSALDTPAASVPAATGTPTVHPTARPTATPAPPYSLDLPTIVEPRQVQVEVVPALEGDGGQIDVSVTNLSDTKITEIVLRWSTELGDSLFLAPFVPSAERVLEFAPPLTLSTSWTKWVEGPGEEGEPAGTTSLGYGPLDPGVTLQIPLFVTRRAEGPVGFDLQLLDDEKLLRLEDGTPAEVRVQTP